MLKIILKAYQDFWLRATDFKGKTALSDWWWVQLVNLIITFFTLRIFLRTYGFNFNVYGLVCLVPQIAIDIRRLRDFGKDWKWIFINLIPVFGWILWFIWLGFGKSGKGNRMFN